MENFKKYFSDWKSGVFRSVGTLHNNRMFWLTIAFFCLFAVIFVCLIFDNYSGMIAGGKFSAMKISFLAIFFASIICAINPTKFISKVIGYTASLIASIVGLKQCCMMLAVYNISDIQNYLVPKKSLSHVFSCIFSIKGDCNETAQGVLLSPIGSALSEVSRYAFINALYVYIAVFVLIIAVLYATLMISAVNQASK